MSQRNIVRFSKRVGGPAGGGRDASSGGASGVCQVCQVRCQVCCQESRWVVVHQLNLVFYDILLFFFYLSVMSGKNLGVHCRNIGIII